MVMGGSTIGSDHLTPKQKKQLQKLERRRQYKDLAIQNTNNSSIASKRSVEKLYVAKLCEERVREYFKYFVPKGPKRSPCINRGYWLRLHAIRSRLDSIREQTTQHMVVVNLGCGFDPLPFELLDSTNPSSIMYHGRVSFLDVDYADMIESKINIINKTPNLLRILGEQTINEGSHIKTSKYEACSCNLNDSASFQSLLESHNLSDPNIIKVFIAEVSLAYMLPEAADNIIQRCGSLSTSHFLLLEQIMPQGANEPFAKQMLKHFAENDSPLKSVMQYSTIQSQTKRMHKLGFPYVNIGDLYQLWELVDSDTRSKIELLEPFDELEEFHSFGHHYCLCHATNNKEFTFYPKYRFHDTIQFEVKPKEDYQITSMKLDLDRKFGAACVCNEQELLYSCGANPSRVSDMLFVSVDDGSLQNINISGDMPVARMCHTLHFILSIKSAVMIGGRSAPGYGFRDTWLYDISAKSWVKGPCLPDTRYRHASCLISDTTVLIFGGEGAQTSFISLNVSTQKTESIICHEKSLLSPLISSAIAYHEQSQIGAILGGEYKGLTTINDTLFLFKLRNGEIQIIEKVRHSLFARYGAKMVFSNDKQLIISGGTSNNTVFGQEDSIISFNLESKTVTTLPIPADIWNNQTVCFTGNELQALGGGRILVFGGGMTCYGFGSIWGQALLIQT